MLQSLHCEKIRPETSKFPMALQHEEGDCTSPWFEFACKSYPLESKLWAIAFLAGTLELELGHEKTWVDQHGELLDSEEKELIEALNGWVHDTDWFNDRERSKVESLSADERDELLLEKMDEALKNQLEAIERLREDVKQRRE